MAPTTEKATAAIYEVKRRGRALTGRRRARRRRPERFAGGDSFVTPLLVNPIEGRSGTTLLMRILDVPDVAFDRVPPFENRYLAYLLHLSSHVAEPYGSNPAWTMDQLLEGDPGRFGPLPFRPSSLDPHDWQIRLVRHGLMGLSESLIAYAPAPPRYYAEKAWGSALLRLAEAGVRAKVVNLVRDPRDVLASIRATDRRRGYSGFGRTPEMTDRRYLEFIVASMVANLRKMDEADVQHDSCLVRYEDLVRDPTVVAHRLGQWLDLVLNVDRSILTGSGFDRHATSETAELSIGRWRSELSGEDVRAVGVELGTTMTRLGYEL